MTETTLYFGGPIVTMDPARPQVEALLERDGRIIDVGRSRVAARASGRRRAHRSTCAAPCCCRASSKRTDIRCCRRKRSAIR